MKHFHVLEVLQKTRETDDSVLLTLGVPKASEAEFRYEQGQHLPLRTSIDGKGIRRTYSICSGVSEQTLRVGIRVQDQGVFSNFVANELQVGDTIESMPPSGHFNIALDTENRNTYVAFVAGSGITPVLSNIKSTLEAEPGSSFVLFYGNRKRSTTMFIEELWALKNMYGERLALHFIMSQESAEIALYEGRIDSEKAATLHNAFLQQLNVSDVFVCGPNPMIDNLTERLLSLGYAPESIHSERFRANKGSTAAAPQPRRTDTVADNAIQVDLIVDGNREQMNMGADETILDAALRQNINLPYSCRSGVCSTCRAKLTGGSAEMMVNYALEPWELEQGYVLTCQAKATAPSLEIDYDQT